MRKQKKMTLKITCLDWCNLIGMYNEMMMKYREQPESFDVETSLMKNLQWQVMAQMDTETITEMRRCGHCVR
jgi:hypothetical protein